MKIYLFQLIGLFLAFGALNAQDQPFYLKFSEEPLPLGNDHYYLQSLLITENASFVWEEGSERYTVSLPIGTKNPLSTKMKSSLPKMGKGQSPLVITLLNVEALDSSELKFDFIYQVPQLRRQDYSYRFQVNPSSISRQYWEDAYLEAILSLVNRVSAIWGHESEIPQEIKEISVEEYLQIDVSRSVEDAFVKELPSIENESSQSSIRSVGYQIGGLGIIGFEVQARVSDGFSMVFGAGYAGAIIGPRFHFSKRRMAPFLDLTFQDGGFGSLGSLGLGLGAYLPFNPQQSLGLTVRVGLGRILYRRTENTNSFLDPNAFYLISFGGGISF